MANHTLSSEDSHMLPGVIHEVDDASSIDAKRLMVVDEFHMPDSDVAHLRIPDTIKVHSFDSKVKPAPQFEQELSYSSDGDSQPRACFEDRSAEVLQLNSFLARLRRILEANHRQVLELFSEQSEVRLKEDICGAATKPLNTRYGYYSPVDDMSLDEAHLKLDALPLVVTHSIRSEDNTLMDDSRGSSLNGVPVEPIRGPTSWSKAFQASLPKAANGVGDLMRGSGQLLSQGTSVLSKKKKAGFFGKRTRPSMFATRRTSTTSATSANSDADADKVSELASSATRRMSTISESFKHRDSEITSYDSMQRVCSASERAQQLQDVVNNTLQNAGPGAYEFSGKRNTKGQMFVDGQALQDEVQRQLRGMEYDVTDLYKEDSYWATVAVSQEFEWLTLSVILINALYIAVEVDYNKADTLGEAQPGFQFAEHSFCLFFVIELIVRFMAFRQSRSCLKDPWFLFDAILVVFMVLETWCLTVIYAATQGSSDKSGVGTDQTQVLKMLKLVRLTRMARIVRLLRAVPELVVLCKGISAALRSVLVTVVLLITVTYMFAIVLTQLSANTEVGHRYFDTVPDAMKNMLVLTAFPDLYPLIHDVGITSWLWLFFFILFLFVAGLTVLNLLVAILVHVVQVVASVEREKFMVEMMHDELIAMLEEADVDGDEQVCLEEFKDLLLKPKCLKFLQAMDVDVVALLEYLDFIFKGGRTFDFADVINLMLQLRGSNKCTVKDIVTLRKWIDNEMTQLYDNLSHLIIHTGHQMRAQVVVNGDGHGPGPPSVHLPVSIPAGTAPCLSRPDSPEKPTNRQNSLLPRSTAVVETSLRKTMPGRRSRRGSALNLGPSVDGFQSELF
eukprot:TRINITY_DN22069_c0_g1_i1.p1 TRINITY_DN22069_c0_g1~~TRINITY_DN22069_c0_g1_i1.p1  ORF type:complete len:873 (+),score=212.92 TRINITY_DN22069_c0_g1_i1:82-2619(+)